jgi:hypothetical protein
MSIETLQFDDGEVLPESRYVERLKLEPKQIVEIDTRRTLLGKKDVQKEMGVDGAMVAGIRAADTAFLVIDTRDSNHYRTPFLITTDTYQHTSSVGYKGIWPNEHVVIGRRHHEGRFQYDSKVSRDHFSIFYDEQEDKLFVQDEASSNGTYLTGFTVDVDQAGQQGIRDEFTHHVVADVEYERNFGERDTKAPYGYYRNHPIIGRKSSSVRGGVYGTRSSEFIVIDDKSRLLKKVVDDFMETLPSGDDAETLSTMSILQRINFRVANVLRYDLERAERISEPHYGHKGLIDLSEYVEHGVGVCRHQALLAAHLIEEVIDKGYLKGRVGVERNHDLEANGAHAWAVYKSDTSEDVIVDPANHFVGSRKRAQKEGRWRYVVAQDDDNR